jgi:ribose transport system substrate-binding protein
MVVFLVLTSVLAFAGSKEEAAGKGEPSAAVEEPMKKVGVMGSWMTHEWYVSVLDGFKDRCDELGFTYTLVDSEGNIEKGVSILENFAMEGVDGILLFPAAPVGYEAGIDAADKAGIPVIVDVINMPDTSMVCYGANPQFNMTRETGRNVAEYIKENWPKDKQVNVLTVNLLIAPNCWGRTDGFLVGLLEGGIDYNWVAEVDGLGNLPTSLEVCNDAFIAHPEINVVVGINDDSMFGGFKAAEQLGLDTDEIIFVGTGLEGPKARRSLIEDNGHRFDTAMFPYIQGVIYANLFNDLFNGKDIPKHVVFPSAAVSSDNFYDYFDSNLNVKTDVVLKLKADDSKYPLSVGWDRKWYDEYKKDPSVLGTKYVY